MKNCFTVFLFLLLMSSCSSEKADTISTATSQENLRLPPTDDLLIAKLTDYNKKNRRANSIACEGFWNCLGHVTAVAGADIVGAGAGVAAVGQIATGLNLATGGTVGTAVAATAGVVAGAGASYAAHVTITQPTPTPTPNTTPSKRINFQNKKSPNTVKYGALKIYLLPQYEYMKNIGKEHNDVIHNNYFKNKYIGEYYVERKMSKQQISILQSKSFKKKMEIINSYSVDYANSKFDYEQLTHQIVNAKIFSPNVKTILDLFLSLYIGQSSRQAMQRQINYYIQEISLSNISNSEKEILMSSFIVASESPFYMIEN